MDKKIYSEESLKAQIIAYEMQLKGLRDLPEKARANNYDTQLLNIARHIKKLKSELDLYK